MHLDHLALTNFRNISSIQDISFAPHGLLIAAAPNATGKTNFLESMYVLLRGRSWRASLPDCIQWDQTALSVVGEVGTEDGQTHQLAVRYNSVGRKLYIEEDGAATSAVTMLTNYPLILFLPDDTFLFAKGPEARRNFLNHILLTLPRFVASLVQFQRLLRQRNASLKQAREYSDVEAWTPLFAAHAQEVWDYRDALTQAIDVNLSRMYEQLTGEQRQFTVALEKGRESNESIEKLLENAFRSEQRFGYTFTGPHRDELLVTTDRRPIQAILSRGQLRGVVLAMKLAASTFVRQTTLRQPLLLLDDVFSELDEQRQVTLLEQLPTDAQIVLTCTHVPQVATMRSDASLLDLRAILAPEGNTMSVRV
jgi:DNA replication and repair protein RecF